MQTTVALIPQCTGQHIFLSCAQAGKSGFGRGGACNAPHHVGVGVVCDHALCKGSDQFLARQSVVIKELKRSRAGRDGIAHHGLLTLRQILVLCRQCWAHLAGHQHLLVIRQLTGWVVLHRQTGGVRMGQSKSRLVKHLAEPQLGHRSRRLCGNAHPRRRGGLHRSGQLDSHIGSGRFVIHTDISSQYGVTHNRTVDRDGQSIACLEAALQHQRLAIQNVRDHEMHTVRGDHRHACSGRCRRGHLHR